MNIYVVYGVDVTMYYPSGSCAIHYCGTDEGVALRSFAENSNDEDWVVTIEKWNDGVMIESRIFGID